MNFFSTGHAVVDQVGSVHLEGNILPTSWFSTFVLESGKPDLNAIVVLSEIVYWHRPTVVRDEYSGQVVCVKKKFKSDLLQRSYQSFSDQYGFSKQQVKEAFDRLEKLGVLKRHFRTIEANNQKYNNVLFIELITPVLFEMTTLPLSKGGGSPFEKADPPHFKRGTNTENTTDINTHSNAQAENQDSWAPDLDRLADALRSTKYSQRVQEILNMENFQFHVDNFNSHHEKNHQLTDNQKLRKFAQWIYLEFEKEQGKIQRGNKKPASSTPVKQNSRNVNDAWGDEQHYEPATDDIDLGDLV